MSRAYDAKQMALQAYPTQREDAIDLFMGIIDISEDDFEFEFNQTPEQYLFGDG